MGQLHAWMNVTLGISGRGQCGCFYSLALEREVENRVPYTVYTSKSNMWDG
jgi:hypothetical protein